MIEGSMTVVLNFLLTRQFIAYVANWATIVTLIGATFAYGRYLWDVNLKMRRVEHHLKEAKIEGKNGGKRSIKHLMAYVSLTEEEVLNACFNSDKIVPVPIRDEHMTVTDISFQYKD